MMEPHLKPCSQGFKDGTQSIGAPVKLLDLMTMFHFGDSKLSKVIEKFLSQVQDACSALTRPNILELKPVRFVALSDTKIFAMG